MAHPLAVNLGIARYPLPAVCEPYQGLWYIEAENQGINLSWPDLTCTESEADAHR